MWIMCVHHTNPGPASRGSVVALLSHSCLRHMHLPTFGTSPRSHTAAPGPPPCARPPTLSSSSLMPLFHMTCAVSRLLPSGPSRPPSCPSPSCPASAGVSSADSAARAVSLAGVVQGAPSTPGQR
jgi:hypothetical protein